MSAVALGGYAPHAAAERTHGRYGRDDLRGNNRDRRARKRWLLDTFGDGRRVTCAHCPASLTFATLTVDRIVPGSQGGRYTRDNILPACRSCNCRRQDSTDDRWTPVTYATPF